MPNNPYTLSLSRFSTHRQVIDSIGRNKKVLDIGCNDGYIGVNSDPSNKFYGIDYLESATLKARLVYIDALVYDLNQLKPLPWKTKFDVIILADVLEHVVEPEKCLHYFVDNYLEDGGSVIVSLPNIANWQMRMNLLGGIFNYTETGILDKTHLHLYTYNSAKVLVESVELKVVKSESGATFFGPVLSILPFLKPLLATSIILVCEK